MRIGTGTRRLLCHHLTSFFRLLEKPRGGTQRPRSIQVLWVPLCYCSTVTLAGRKAATFVIRLEKQAEKKRCKALNVCTMQCMLFPVLSRTCLPDTHDAPGSGIIAVLVIQTCGFAQQNARSLGSEGVSSGGLPGSL